jgi:glycosyltransferase involved in cell wall biosynthesis
MKLVFFTPAIKTSAIGRMACLVTRALVSQGHTVSVVRTETERLLETPTHDFGVGVIQWNDFNQVLRLNSEADALVYQIGDNYEFHRGCLEWLPNSPGLVCLHDFFLGHLFWGWAQTRRQQADAVLRNWYGAEIASRFFGYSSSEEFIEATSVSSPMTEWVCSMAHGVLTHSNWGVGRLLNSCPGPVHVVPLAYDAPILSSHKPLSCGSENQQFRLLTIGHINPNKRVASVICAIGNSPAIRQRTVYRLVGQIQPATVLELSALARKCHVNLLISGEVDDATLGLALQEADVVSCLRWPSLEAASASAIEAMLYGKPIIVTDTGFYAEIPSGCALKIAPDEEISELQSTLERLATDPSLREEVGMCAKQWASKQCSAENYASQLVACVTDICRTAPPIRAIKYFSNLMQHWRGSVDMLPERDVAALRLFEG